MASCFTSHFIMLEKKFKIRESVDIYVINDNESNTVKIQFYKINTREKTTIQIDKSFTDILQALDGNNTLSETIDSLNLSIEPDDLSNIFDFLRKKGLLKEIQNNNLLTIQETERYSRQINYFDNLIPAENGENSQHKLLCKKVLIIGVGATGAAIASQLLRAGVTNLKIIDPKRIQKSSIARHIYANQQNIGQYKVDALAEYLKKINSQCSIQKLTEKLLPTTDLSQLIDDDTDLVINTADEPYIGHITLKLGRYLWNKGIGLYVSGGFDAHLMSTGELICKGLTPCADCCSNTFQKALANWKPKYNSFEKSTVGEKNIPESVEKHFPDLSAGGMFSQSLYSASLAVMNIIDYLLDNSQNNDKLNKRGEYLINQGENNWFEMKKQEGCERCGS